ncbi:hypothetical protein FACS1894217_01050 [Clostridia bacterium]|nr:hypothetical protein FACS1894217_01050 [Clostridia bacterium]
MPDTRYLARLAKIHLPDDELERLTDDMTAIMKLMDTIQTVQLPDGEYRPQGVNIADLREDTAELRLPVGTLSDFTIPKLMEGQ